VAGPAPTRLCCEPLLFDPVPRQAVLPQRREGAIARAARQRPARETRKPPQRPVEAVDVDRVLLSAFAEKRRQERGDRVADRLDRLRRQGLGVWRSLNRLQLSRGSQINRRRCILVRKSAHGV
jgi:hypothetical protein